MTHGTYLSATMTTTLAVILLTTAALADTQTASTLAAEDTVVSGIDDLSLARAEEATRVATARAIATVLADTKLDLDIRLIGPTSTTVASHR